MKFRGRSATSKSLSRKFLLKQNPFNLENFKPRNIPAIRYLERLLPIFIKTTKICKKLNPLVNQQNDHRLISEARFVTSHLISFNNQNYRIIEESLVFQCQPYLICISKIHHNTIIRSIVGALDDQINFYIKSK